jgi:hypothetical protein
MTQPSHDDTQSVSTLGKRRHVELEIDIDADEGDDYFEDIFSQGVTGAMSIMSNVPRRSARLWTKALEVRGHYNHFYRE